MKTSPRKMAVLAAFALIVSQGDVLAQKRPELAPTPPMGWNSWNWFGKPNINETIVRQTIDLLVETGLKDAGYNYVVIDGGWRDTKTGPNGELVPHPVKFPNGIKALADYAHSKGLKFGLHTVPGTHDCGGDAVGGYNKEELHISQFVAWGLDFIKVDLCKQTIDPCGDCEKSSSGWSEQNIRNTYFKWSKLLRDCGRPILFNISAYRFRDWNPECCNMSRTTQDLKPHINGGAVFNSPGRANKGLLSVMAIAEFNNKHAAAAGNGYWNDADMMANGDPALSFEEQQSHFALWCIMSSPLFLGNDLSRMNKAELELIKNKNLITINQDPSEQGKLITTINGVQIWKKKLKGGECAVMLLNLDTSSPTKPLSLDLVEAGLQKVSKPKDLIADVAMTVEAKRLTVSLKPHQSVMFLVRE